MWTFDFADWEKDRENSPRVNDLTKYNKIRALKNVRFSDQWFRSSHEVNKFNEELWGNEC